MLPPEVIFRIYEGVGALPHFNDPEDTPQSVLDFREQIRQADAVIICTPEYAFGVPGSLKNALDWTVGSGDFINKPVALITASSQGEKGHAALLLILTAISARIIEKSSFVISFIRAKMDEKGAFKDSQTRTTLQFAIDTLIQEVSQELIKQK
jgi:NAD(P)H-dependent FMN reductase